MKKQSFYVALDYSFLGPDRIEFIKLEGKILKHKAPDGTSIQIGVAKDSLTGKYKLTEITTGCKIPVKEYKYKYNILMQLTLKLLQKIANALKTEKN